MVRNPHLWIAVIAAVAVLGATGDADARRRKKNKKKVADKAAKAPSEPKASPDATPDPAPAAEPVASESDGGGGKKGKRNDKPAELDFTGLNFEGRLRTPQLLYFLDRAAEELERASLERRSFIPEMVKSIDEEDL